MSQIEHRGYSIITKPAWLGGVDARIELNGRSVFEKHHISADDLAGAQRKAKNIINWHLDPPIDDEIEVAS